MTSTQDVRFSYGAVEEGWKLANKLWNVSRLLLSDAGQEVAARPASVEERWILARIDATRAEVEDALSGFRFFVAANALYHLVFDDFCDWYAEAIKPRLYDRDPDTVATALFALDRVLRLLHPLMPHVTEEIWTQLPARERAADRLAVARRLTRRCGRSRRARCGQGGGRRSTVVAASLPRSRAMRSGSSRRSSGRARPTTAPLSREAEAARLRQGDRPCRGHARQRALRSPTRRPTSSKASARSSPAIAASSMPSAGSHRKSGSAPRSHDDFRRVRHPERPLATTGKARRRDEKHGGAT